MSLVAKLLLGPLLIWQGRQVRASALRLPEPDGPRVGKVGEGKPLLSLLIVGDSSAAGVGVGHQSQGLALQLAEQLHQRLDGAVAWQLVAQSGHRSDQALHLLAATTLAPADVLITALGVNDVVDQQAPEATLAALNEINVLARARAGVRWTLHCAAPPMHAFPVLPQPLRWFLGGQATRLNDRLGRALAGDSTRRLLALPHGIRANAAELMARDGFHPGAAGYRAWASALAHEIERWLQTTGGGGRQTHPGP